MKREIPIQVKVTADEKERLEAQAGRERMALSTWMRAVLLAVADKGEIGLGVAMAERPR